MNNEQRTKNDEGEVLRSRQDITQSSKGIEQVKLCFACKGVPKEDFGNEG